MSHMEMIYIDGEGQATKTGVGAMMETAAATWADFRSRKRLAVPIDEARFVLDYYNRKGDLADSIPLSEDGYRLITGQPVLSERQYRRIDRTFWKRQEKLLREGRSDG